MAYIIDRLLFSLCVFISEDVYQIINFDLNLRLDDVAEPEWSPRTKLKYFAEYCFDLTNKEFHEKWYDTIQNPNVMRGLIIAPRNSAKSTSWGRIAPLWLLGCDPDIQIVLISRTSTLAKIDLRFIRQSIESNDKVKEVFPFERDPITKRVRGLEPSSPWGEEQLTIRNNRKDGTPSVYAVGLEGSISGIRADIIIVDDLIDMNNVMTDSQRRKVDDFWNSVVTPTLNPGGRVFAIGTRWHNKDFYSRLLDDPEYKDNTFMFPAIKVDEKGEYLLDADGNMQSYWPERWSVEALLKQKESMGSLAFNCQMMCDPSGYAGRLFDPDWIQYYDPEKILLPIWSRLEFVMAVDPNITSDPSSDNTAIITGALDRKYSTLYILDMYAKPLDFVDQLKILKQYGKRIQVEAGVLLQPEMRITKIGVEAVAYQRALQQSGYFAGLPVVEIQHQKSDKTTRILRVQPHIENGRVLFPISAEGIQPRWWDGFYEEYCTFPRGRRDDRMDALETLITMVSSSFGESGIPWGPTDEGMMHRDGRDMAGGFPARLTGRQRR